MVHTVALLGATGRVGSLVLPHLVRAHQDGKIRLIVLARSPSAFKNDHGEEVEVREVNLEDAASLDKALLGVHVVLASIANDASALEINIVEALHRSPTAITFIPSRYGGSWLQDDFDRYPALGFIAAHLNAVHERAKELDVGVTHVQSGMFDNYLFQYKMVDTDLLNNKIQANQAQLAHPLPVTNMEDLASGLADLAVRDPESIKNTQWSVISHWVTGNDLVEVFTKLHNGAKTQVTRYGKAEEEETLARPFGAMAAATKYRWQFDKEVWRYPKELAVVPARSVEQSAADSLMALTAA